VRFKTSGPFSIASDRAALERQADAHPAIGERMRAIDARLRERGVRKLVSYGVGGAVPELWLLRLDPGRRLVVTEYAPGTLERLQKLLPEAEVQRHDLLRDPPLGGDLHLFHRVDTELDNGQWRGVYERFSGRTVVLVASEVISAREIPRKLLKLFLNRHMTRTGWIRTRGVFESLWQHTHCSTHVEFADLEGWVLDPRR
jgi:hypothetical protein